MDTSNQLKAATRRKSSYSGTSGGDCVEVAPLTHSPEAYAAFIDHVRMP